MLRVENLTKKFKDSVAVDNISFDVIRGRIFGLLGPNGAGKTTTIRTILNILKPTSGTITFDGKLISNEIFNIIGYLPEERGLYKKSKALDVITYFARLKNLSKVKAEDESKFWMEKLEIKNLANKRLEELSKGNQQKIQFICAVVHNPEILILDEPFSGFDPINQETIKDILLSFTNAGKIIILCTHQMETAEKLCSDIFLIDKGKEVCSGSLVEVKKSFGGNLVKVEFSGDGSFLSSLPEVININSYNNYAEIELREDVKPYEFLRLLVTKIIVTHFSIVEPTLNKIFIDAIKNRHQSKTINTAK
jgi:ABC-2 type transport system ATP-binding protein